jgi:hypothetical protein
MKKSNINPTKTVLTICTGILVIYCFTKLGWLIYLAMAIGLTGMFSSMLSLLIDRLWMKLAWLLGLVIPNILLAIVFYFVIFPITLLSRLFRRIDFLTLKNRDSSLFTNTGKQFTATSFTKPW